MSLTGEIFLCSYFQMITISDHHRASYANLVSMLTSIVASSQQPDPSEIGLFDAPLRPRSRNYKLLDSKYT